MMYNRFTVKNTLDNYPLGLGWYKFYVYARMPLGMISSIAAIMNYKSVVEEAVSLKGDALYDQTLLNSIISMHTAAISMQVLFLVFSAVLFWLMLHLHKASYIMNMIFIFLTCVDIPLNTMLVNNFTLTTVSIITFITSAVVLCAAWGIPNFIYFKKRRSLFIDVQSDINKSKCQTFSAYDEDMENAYQLGDETTDTPTEDEENPQQEQSASTSTEKSTIFTYKN